MDLPGPFHIDTVSIMPGELADRPVEIGAVSVGDEESTSRRNVHHKVRHDRLVGGALGYGRYRYPTENNSTWDFDLSRSNLVISASSLKPLI